MMYTTIVMIVSTTKKRIIPLIAPVFSLIDLRYCSLRVGGYIWAGF